MANTAPKKTATKADAVVLTVDSFVQRTTAGETLNSPAELEFYKNNSAAIEEALKAKSDGSQQATAPGIKKFNPTAGAVDEKSYAGASAGMQQTGQVHQEPIIQEFFQQAPDENIQEIPGSEINDKPKEKPEKKAFNPEMQGLPDKEKEAGAAAMTDILLNTLAQGYKAVNSTIQFKEKQINKLQNDGVIDVRIEVPYKMGVAPIGTVFRDFNEDASKLLVLEPEWVEAVHPLITEELAKAGHGMSSRGQLVYLCTTKLVSDGIKVAQFLSLKKDYLKFAREAMAQNKRPVKTVVMEQPVVVAPPAQQESVSDNGGENGHDSDDLISGLSLQDQKLKEHYPGGLSGKKVTGQNNKTLEKLNKEEKKSAVKKTSTGAGKKYVQQAKAAPASNREPVPGPNRAGKKGRPPGSKNKPKK